MRERLDPGVHADLLAMLARVEAWAEAQYAALAPVFAVRLAGEVRECHGDLHLGNLVVLDGEPRLFDAIEFSAELRWTDVVADVAFLVMDLQARGRPALGWRFLNAWLERCGDYAGLRVLPYYLSYRAMVRAKIAAIRATQLDGAARDASVDECRATSRSPRRRWRQARRPCWWPAGCRARARPASRRPWWRRAGDRVRADVERKRLAGLAAEATSGSGLGGGLSTPEATVQTYARLAELVRGCSRPGARCWWTPPSSSTPGALPYREFLAHELGVPFAILAFDASGTSCARGCAPAWRPAATRPRPTRPCSGRSCAGARASAAEELARVPPIDTGSAPDWGSLLPALSRAWLALRA